MSLKLSMKQRLYMYGSVLFITIAMSVIISTYHSNVVSNQTLYNMSSNILLKSPVSINSSQDKNVFYVPPHYKYSVVDESVILSNKSDGAILTLYFGQEKKIDKNFIEAFKSKEEPKFSEIQYDTDYVSNYFMLWEDIENSRTKVIIGKQDSFIIGEFPSNVSTSYVKDMSYILNSFRRI